MFAEVQNYLFMPGIDVQPVFAFLAPIFCGILMENKFWSPNGKEDYLVSGYSLPFNKGIVLFGTNVSQR